MARFEAVPSGLTQDGLLAGTPTYMSPEQAGGDESTDARSDVYSLGATLYEALTGEVPFRGAPHMVLRQIEHDEPRPLRQLNDSVPRDLETICLKAMAKEPGRRYATAGELADDLRRWLRGEPIHARPTGSAERLWRWSRRNRRVAGLTTALVLVFLVGFAGVFYEWWRAEANLRDREESLLQSCQAVNVLSLTNTDELRGKVEMQDALRSEVERYQRLLAQRTDDPVFRFALASAYYQFGVNTREVGRSDEALEAFQKAQPLYGELCREHPGNSACRLQLGANHLYIGLVHYATGHMEEAVNAQQEALAEFEQLTRERGNCTLFSSLAHRACVPRNAASNSSSVVRDWPGEITAAAQSIQFSALSVRAA